MEDLEVNPLYKAFLTKFKLDFELARKLSHLIVIPLSQTIEDQTIDHFFASSHILVPSKLLKMHYNQLQMGNFDDIEVEDKRLVCCRRSNERLLVNIVAEETVYNATGSVFKLLLVDKPLVLPVKQKQIVTAFKGILAPLSPNSPSVLVKQRRAHLISSRMLSHHDDCAKYLEFISQDLTMSLEYEIKRLQSNYIIMSRYLDDAEIRTRNIAGRYIQMYERALEASWKGQFDVCDIIQKTIQLSVENYVVYLMHGKLMAAVQNYYEREDKLLEDKFNLMLASKLGICQLGAQEEFSAFLPDEHVLQLLRRLPNLQSPIAIVSCLMELVDLISGNLNESVRMNRFLTYNSRSSEKLEETESQQTTSASIEPVPICTDDLIATFVYCLSRARPNNLYSLLRYLEQFGWETIRKEQISYYLTTFESSIMYTLNSSIPTN